MMPHLRYLRYVVLHKLYVFMAGIAIARHVHRAERWPRVLWRYLVHDLSKFRPSEWSPYVANFYGKRTDTNDGARFDRAWLLHIHRNPHHWQHWILREDSGSTKVLLPEAWFVDEMVADWLGAGVKILSYPSLSECVAMTIAWYMGNRQKIVLRDPARQRVEGTLRDLAALYGIVDMAFQERSRLIVQVPTRA